MTTETAWDRVVGQDRAVALLQRATERPVHSYLLVGPRGAGVEEAARCFAAALLADDPDERTWELALGGRHPDIVEIDPPESILRVEVVRTIVEEAFLAPVEGDRKVIIVFDAERLNEAAANKLLKTLEEPPRTTHILLVTAVADALLATIVSRCQRVDFGPLDEATVCDALVAGGVAADDAAVAARLAGGRLDRARGLAGRYHDLRAAFVDAAARLDGSGAAVAMSAEALQSALADVVAGLDEQHEEQAAALGADLEASGYPARTAQAMQKRLAERQRREHRRARIDALIEGITALETVYRDALAGPTAPARNTDRPLLALDARSCGSALDACRAARQVLLEHNPNESLLVERLRLHLPAATTRSDGRAPR